MKRLSSLRFDPKAQDGDGDGFVQDNTPFERPVFLGAPIIPEGQYGQTVRAGSKSTTGSSGLFTQFALPVNVGGRRVISSLDIADLPDPPHLEALIDLFRSSAGEDDLRRQFGASKFMTLPDLPVFPDYALISGIDVSGLNKKKSSALITVVPMDGDNRFVALAIHVSDEVASIINSTGTSPLSVMERLRSEKERKVDDIRSKMALEHLSIPTIGAPLDKIVRQYLNSGIPQHAVPILVSFMDDLSSRESELASAIPLIRSISFWNNPASREIHDRIYVFSHEIGHLFDVIPPNYGEIFGQWRQVLAQDKLPRNFSDSQGYATAIMDDFLANQSRRLESSGISQIFATQITPEFTQVTDYAMSIDDARSRAQEDFADSFALFLVSELTGMLGRRLTGDKETLRFGDIYPNRDRFIRQLFESFGVTNIGVPSGSRSTTRSTIHIPRININTPDFPNTNYGKWSTTAPVLGPNTKPTTELIDESSLARTVGAMRMLRRRPYFQGRAVRWMMGDLTKFGNDDEYVEFEKDLRALDRLLDIAPEINVSTMYRVFDAWDSFEPLGDMAAGTSVYLKAAPVAFSIPEAIEMGSRASQMFGNPFPGHSVERILLAIPKTARGIIYDDSSVNPESWEGSPREAIIRGRFEVSSVSEKNGMRIVNLRHVSEHLNNGRPFFYVSTESKLPIGKLILHNDSISRRGISKFGPSSFRPLITHEYAGKYLHEIDRQGTAPSPEKTVSELNPAMSAISKVTASYQIGDFGDAVSFGKRVSPVGSKSSARYKFTELFLDDRIFTEADDKDLAEIMKNFDELGLDYDIMKERLRQIILDRAKLLGPRKFKREIRQAMRWYSDVRKGLVNLTKELNELESMKSSKRKFAKEEIFAVMAALSPQARVEPNTMRANIVASVVAKDEIFTLTIPDGGIKFKGDAYRPILKWLLNKNGSEFTPSSFIAEFMDEFKDKSNARALESLARIHPELFGAKGTSGIANVIKSLFILYKTDTINKILSGMKVRSFYLNFINPKGPHVTIDTWMYRIMVPEDVIFTKTYKDVTHSGNLRELAKKFGTDFKTQDLFQKSQQKGVKVGVYPLFAQIIRELATEFGEDFPDLGSISPADMQAFLWELARQTWRPGRPEKPTNWDEMSKWFYVL